MDRLDAMSTFVAVVEAGSLSAAARGGSVRFSKNGLSVSGL